LRVTIYKFSLSSKAELVSSQINYSR